MSRRATLKKYRSLQQNWEKIWQVLDRYDHEQLNQKPPSGGWSAMQVCAHLYLAEAGSWRYVLKKRNADDLPNASLRSAWRSFVLNSYLRMPFKFKAPEGVGEQAMQDYYDPAEMKARWKKLRETMHSGLAEMDDRLFRKAIYKHPIIGRMSLRAMLSFFNAHQQRHFGQMRRALKASI